jgi:hypothetical protein
LGPEKDHLQFSEVGVERSHTYDVSGRGWAGTARGSGKAKEVEGINCYQDIRGRLGVLKERSPCPKKGTVHGQTAWRTMSQETYEGGFLHSFRDEMRGFHDYLNRSHPPCSRRDRA